MSSLFPVYIDYLAHETMNEFVVDFKNRYCDMVSSIIFHGKKSVLNATILTSIIPVTIDHDMSTTYSCMEYATAWLEANNKNTETPSLLAAHIRRRFIPSSTATTSQPSLIDTKNKTRHRITSGRCEWCKGVCVSRGVTCGVCYKTYLECKECVEDNGILAETVCSKCADEPVIPDTTPEHEQDKKEVILHNHTPTTTKKAPTKPLPASNVKRIAPTPTPKKAPTSTSKKAPTEKRKAPTPTSKKAPPVKPQRMSTRDMDPLTREYWECLQDDLYEEYAIEGKPLPEKRKAEKESLISPECEWCIDKGNKLNGVIECEECYKSYYQCDECADYHNNSDIPDICTDCKSRGYKGMCKTRDCIREVGEYGLSYCYPCREAATPTAKKQKTQQVDAKSTGACAISGCSNQTDKIGDLYCAECDYLCHDDIKPKAKKQKK